MDNYFGSGSDINIRSVLDILKHMEDCELEKMIKDSSNEQIDSLIKDLPQLKSLEAERERLIQTNRQTAENNLSLEPTYRMSKRDLAKALEECQLLKNELDKKKAKVRELSRQTSLDTTFALLQAAMAEAEEASEEVANSFLTNQLPIEEFIKNFIEQRKLFHSRRIKSEKMPAEIQKVNMSGVLQPTRPAPPPPTLPFSQMAIRKDENPPYPMSSNPFAEFISQPPGY